MAYLIDSVSPFAHPSSSMSVSRLARRVHCRWVQSPNLWTMVCILVFLLSASLLQAQVTPSTQQYEARVSRLEDRVSELQRSPAYHGVDVGGVSFLFGAFCALWAQNTRRSAWLWFFLGFFFSVITVIVLLVKNSNDRIRREREELHRRLHPPGSPPVFPGL
jgi:hypothetical protein